MKEQLSDQDKNGYTNTTGSSRKEKVAMSNKVVSLKNKRVQQSLRQRDGSVPPLVPSKTNTFSSPHKGQGGASIGGSSTTVQQLRRTSKRSSLADGGSCPLPTRCYDMDVGGETVIVCEGDNRYSGTQF